MSPEFHWVSTVEEFAPWREAWLDLLRDCPSCRTPFHHPAWIEGCWRCPRNRIAAGLVAQGRRLLCGMVFNAEIDTGKALLMPARLLSLTPHISSAHPACLVAVARPGFDTRLVGPLLDRALRSLRWRVLFLNFLDQEHAWVESAFREAAARRGWIVRDGESSTDAFISVAGGAEGYTKRRGSNFRKNQRRSLRQLEEMGKVEIFEAAGRPAVPDAALHDEIVQIFEKSWQRDSLHSPLHPVFRPHTLRMLALMREAGFLRVYFLRVGGRPAAFEFGFADRHAGGTYYACARGYDEALRKPSPGNLIAEFTIQDAWERGLGGIYLGAIHLSADTAYKKNWLTEERSVRNCLIIPPRSFYGWVHQLYEKSALFRRIWWRLKLGEAARKALWLIHGPTA